MKKILLIFAIVALMTLGLAVPAAANGGGYEFGVTVSPLIEENWLGEEHTVTATLDTALGDPATVDFYIEAGPNAGEGETVYLIAGDTQATFTYVGDGGPGLDVIDVSVNGGFDGFGFSYKIWLSDKVSGGGTIIQEIEGAKKKDAYKISWGGWASDVPNFLPAGQIEVTFHNVSEDQLDGATFVNEEFFPGSEIGYAEILSYEDVPGFDPYPPASLVDCVVVGFPGHLLDKDGNDLGDAFLVIAVLDGGEPSVEDAVVFFVDCYDLGLSYESTEDFEPVDPENTDGATGYVTPLDNGNVQVVYPPAG